MRRTSAYSERTGIRLFFWNLWYYFFMLVTLNVFFVLCCIPVVTAGPALAALCRMCCLLADGQPLVYPVKEFWTAFRDNFKQGFCAGLISCGYLLAIVYSLLTLNNLENVGFLRMLIWVALIVFLLCVIYVFPQIAMLKLTLKQIFGNAVRMMLVRPMPSAAAVVLACMLILGPLCFLPLSIIFYFIIIFSISALICCSFAWPGIRKYLVAEEQLV